MFTDYIEDYTLNPKLTKYVAYLECPVRDEYAKRETVRPERTARNRIRTSIKSGGGGQHNDKNKWILPFFLTYIVGDQLLLVTDMRLEGTLLNHCVSLLNRFKIHSSETSGIFSKVQAIAWDNLLSFCQCSWDFLCYFLHVWYVYPSHLHLYPFITINFLKHVNSPKNLSS